LVSLYYNQSATIGPLVASNSTPYAGQTIQLTATVKSSLTNGPDPAGTVQYVEDGTVLGTATIASDVATFTTPALQTGTHIFSAIYQGDSLHSVNHFGKLSISVPVQQSTTTTLTVGPNGLAGIGQAVQMTAAQVSSSAGPVTVGTVNFTDGVVQLGSANLDGTDKASLTLTDLGSGSHSLVASYAENSQFSSSSSPSTTEVIGSNGLHFHKLDAIDNRVAGGE